MIKFSRQKFKLRPRARIVRTFGEELISNDHVAVIELVKNSYDADAHLVTITLEAPLEKNKGRIKIEDDGTGMSPKDMQDYWMEPASINKHKSRLSKAGRPYLGQKGIGRFSTAKLARRLTITSLKEGHPEVEVNFDWEDYYKPDIYLDQVEGRWETRAAKVFTNPGTILDMTGLRTPWDAGKVQDMRVQLQRLINPLESPSNFRIQLLIPEYLGESPIEIEPAKMLDNPHYSIKASLESNNKLSLSYKSSSDFPEDEDFVIGNPKLDSGKPPVCGPVSFEFRVWDRDKLDDLAIETQSPLKDIKLDLKNSSGVSVYRDGFRVSPYGNRRNDWLGLDMRRVNKPAVRVSNNQVVGRISITDKDNPDLKDQTNREGIVESDAFRDLQDVALLVLTELESRRYKARRFNEPPKDSYPTLMREKVTLSLVREKVEKKLPDDKEMKGALDKQEEDINKQVEELRDIVVRYRRLSTLGQLVDIVLHDARSSLSVIGKGVQIIEDEMKHHLPDPPNKVKRNLLHIRHGLRMLINLFKRLEPFGGRRRERAKDINIEDAVRDILEIYESQLKNLSVNCQVPATKTKIKISEPDLKLMLINLLDNSIFWLKKTSSDSRLIKIEVDTKDHYVEIKFMDNGPGISLEDAPYIFDPYFSKKPNGVGLGLTIVGEIAHEYEGKLDLIDSDKGASFRINLPVRGRSR